MWSLFCCSNLKKNRHRIPQLFSFTLLASFILSIQKINWCNILICPLPTRVVFIQNVCVENEPVWWRWFLICTCLLIVALTQVEKCFISSYPASFWLIFFCKTKCWAACWFIYTCGKMNKKTNWNCHRSTFISWILIIILICYTSNSQQTLTQVHIIGVNKFDDFTFLSLTAKTESLRIQFIGVNPLVGSHSWTDL